MRYLNGVLTVIAFCLVMITASLLHLIPEAKAGVTNQAVKPTPVNIMQINGYGFEYGGSQPAIKIFEVPVKK